MGRPYHEEIAALHTTYEWANAEDVDGLRRVATRIQDGPLLIAGSGGSLSGAKLAARLHESATGWLARAATPHDLAGLSRIDPSTSILLLTARGSNPDILSALESARRLEPRQIIALVMRKGSKLAGEFNRSTGEQVFEFSVPFGKDGYLATNSLLGTAVILQRIISPECELPIDFPSLLGHKSTDQYLEHLRKMTSAVLARRFVIAMHDSACAVGAADLETRCSETALCAVQNVDMRNFAHGRHQWLAVHGKDTGILCLHTNANGKLAAKTRRLIPAEIPSSLVDLGDAKIEYGGVAVRSLVASILLAKVAADIRGVDPGRPSVPDYGRKLYRLRAGKEKAARPSLKTECIERKARAAGLSYHQVERAYDLFVSRLAAARFGGVVLDYDGTLISSGEKQLGPRATVVDGLRQILEAGVIVGIATGRGRSVRTDLQRALPKKHWRSILIGYYNGAQLGLLNDDTIPVRQAVLSDELQQVYDELMGHPLLSDSCTVTARGLQITLEVGDDRSLSALRALVGSIVATCPPARMVQSSHSIDVLAAGVTKLKVVTEVERMATANSEILCVGDRGCYPGNDFELLSTAFSLSVECQSPRSDSCWRLTPAGTVGVDATLEYLGRLVPMPGKRLFQLDVRSWL